jgi:hypothetical protein
MVIGWLINKWIGGIIVLCKFLYLRKIDNMKKEERFLKYYTVTENGVVRNIRKGNVLVPCISDRGYYHVTGYVEGKTVRCKVSRLVAVLYLPNTWNLPEVNHVDFDKTNDRVWNLEWCTSEYNKEHAHKNGRYKVGEDVHTAKLNEGDVKTIRGRLRAGEGPARVYLDYRGVLGWWTFRDLCRGKTWKGVG